MTAEGGVRYLIWKEDGNSRHLPTPIWAQRLSADGTRLVGERHQLLRNEAQWEGPLIEGPFILQRNGWLYMFYSAGACCGRSCDYRLGVARARRLLGPWERNPANPILSGNDAWKCPGHGTVVTTASGRSYLLYHAYRPGDFEYSGRQGLLDEVTWGDDAWPMVNGGRGPSANAAAPLGVPEKDPAAIGDEFEEPRLSPAWQWPWNHPPVRTLREGVLTLTVADADAANAAGTVIARPTTAGNYVAVTRLFTSTLQSGGSAGLAAYGNGENALGISVASGRATVWRREKAVQSTMGAANLPPTDAVLLRLEASDGRRFRFAASADEGRTWQPVGEEAEGGYLPPWDLGVRVALVAGGPAGTRARFDWLHLDATR